MRPLEIRLLSSISALAMAATIAVPAMAADVVYDVPSPPAVEYPAAGTKAWIALEGRFNIFASSPFTTYAPVPLDSSPDFGWGGSVELGFKPATMNYDFVGRFTYQHSEGDDGFNYYGGYYVAGAESEQSLMLADFEIGREIGVGTRIHAGLRFAHYDGSQDMFVYNGGAPYYAYATGDSSFTGIGPRIGVDHRVGLTDTLALDLSAAGAALYGKREGTLTGYYSSPGPSFPIFNTTSENRWVLNGEASAALTYTMGNTSISGGYRVDYFSNIATSFADGSAQDHFTHGPFLKAKFKFGG